MGLVLGTILAKSYSSWGMNAGAKWPNGIYGTKSPAEALLLPHIHMCALWRCLYAGLAVAACWWAGCNWKGYGHFYAESWPSLESIKINHLKGTKAQINCSQNTEPTVCFTKGQQDDCLWRFGSLSPQEKNHSFGLWYFFLDNQAANINQKIFCWQFCDFVILWGNIFIWIFCCTSKN